MFNINKHFFIGACATLLFTTGNSSAANLVLNGDLSSWSGGVPVSWTGTAASVTQVGAIDGGAGSSALVTAGQAAGLSAALSGSTTANFEVDFTMASLLPTGGGTNRSLYLILAQGSAQIFDMIVVQDGSTGKLQVDLRNTASSAWVPIIGGTSGLPDLNPSTISGTSWTSLNAYNFKISMNLNATPSFSIAYQAAGAGSWTTALSNDTTDWFAAPTVGAGLSGNGVLFADASSVTAGYAFSDVSVTAVPEPGALALLAGAGAVVAGLRGRRRAA